MSGRSSSDGEMTLARFWWGGPASRCRRAGSAPAPGAITQSRLNAAHVNRLLRMRRSRRRWVVRLAHSTIMGETRGPSFACCQWLMQSNQPPQTHGHKCRT